MIGKFFLLSSRNIRHRQVRSWLTILGIVVGVALIVSLVSLGKGLENAVSQLLTTFGSDLVTIMPGESEDPLAGMVGVMAGATIRDKEIDLIEDIQGINFFLCDNL